LKCCGQPRAIADLFRSGAVKRFLSEPINAKTPLDVKAASINLSQMDADLSKAVIDYYARENNLLGQILQLEVPGVQKLLIQAALCWEVSPQAISPINNKSYAEIAKENFLIPWKSTIQTIQYTYPFLFYGDKLDSRVGILRSHGAIQGNNLDEMNITYQTLLLPQTDKVAALYDNGVKGTAFEDAIAATLYARFLTLTQYNHDKEINLQELIPTTWPGRLAEAKVSINFTY